MASTVAYAEDCTPEEWKAAVADPATIFLVDEFFTVIRVPGQPDAILPNAVMHELLKADARRKAEADGHYDRIRDE